MSQKSIETIQDEIIQVIAEKADWETEKLEPQVSIRQDLNLDSLELIDLFMALEDHFQLTIPEEEIGDIKTIQDAINIVSKKYQ